VDDLTLRAARDDENVLLEDVEREADTLLEALLRPTTPFVPAPATERTSAPGFTLVAEDGTGQLVGFVHVLEDAGEAHLEQVSVRPSHGRRGIGRALVGAACTRARDRGHRSITLRTFADVPWNAPFYRSVGFVETEPAGDAQLARQAAERTAGLDRLGRRVQMTREL
jgi:GNAT superfamily N-acetyltransferase